MKIEVISGINWKKWVFRLLLLNVFIFNCFKVFSQSEITYEPDTTFTSNNISFALSVNINNVNNLFGVAFDVVFDTNYIQFETIEEGNFLNESGTANTIFMYDVQADRVVVAINRTDYTQPGVTTIDDTALVHLSFQSINYGWTELTFENVGLFDPELNQIPFNAINGVVDIMGPPIIQNIPDTSFFLGDTLNIHLNDFVNDTDTPDSLLLWEVLQADSIGHSINTENNILGLYSPGWLGNTNVVVQVSDPNDFYSIDTFNVEVLLPVGLPDFTNENIQELDFAIYPNPFKDNTTIKVNNAKAEFILMLFSIDGQLIAIREYQNTKGIQSLNYELGENIPQGTYFLNMILGNQFKTKIIIKK